MGIGREAIEAQDRKMETTRSTVKEHKDLTRFGWWGREMKKIVSSLDAIPEFDTDSFQHHGTSGRMTGRTRSALPHDFRTLRFTKPRLLYLPLSHAVPRVLRHAVPARERVLPFLFF